MSIIKLCDTFAFYGLDVAVAAALCCIIVQILKKTLFKNAQKKILTLLPFVIGTVIYAAYGAIVRMSFDYLTNFSELAEHGLAVGSLSTVMYVYYEQFVRKENKSSASEEVICALIEGFVPSDMVEEAARRISDALLKDVTGGGADKALAILKEACGEDADENDMKLLSRLIIETLAQIAAGKN